MSKKTIVSLLLIGILVLVVSCGGDSSNSVAPVSSKDVDVSTMTGTATDWFPANASTRVSLTNIPEDELLVVKVSPVSGKGTSTVAKATDSRLLPSETGASIITSDKDNSCDFSGSEAGFGNSTQMMQITKIPVVKVEKDEYNPSASYELKVVDAYGKSNGKYYIPNSKCGEYYVDERAMYFDLTGLSSPSKCVLVRNFQYGDRDLADDPDYEGLHNTRDTYGLILYDDKGYPYIKNSGVMDLSGLSSVMVYAGIASNVIMGSGMTVLLTPVTPITELNSEITISDNTAAIGIELESYPENTKYALVISDFKYNNFVMNFSLSTTSTEVRAYDGKSLHDGFPLSYLEKQETLTYYIGELSGNAYIDIHKENAGSYKAKLVTVSDEEYNSFTKEKKNTVYLVVTSESDTTSYSDSALVLKETYTTLDKDNNIGEMIYNLTGFPVNKKIHYTVKFQHWDESKSKWVDTNYDSSPISCTINHSNTGNRLLENDIKASTGSFPVRMRYWDIQGPVRAVISFSE